MSRRRKLVWARLGNVTYALTSAADMDADSLLVNYALQAGATTMGVTVMRVRLSVFVNYKSAYSDPVYVGVRVANKEQLQELATTEDLDFAPQRDPYADWMWWQALYPNHGSDSTNGVPNAATYECDVRAMRRMEELGQDLGIFFGKETTTDTATVSWTSSVLLALP